MPIDPNRSTALAAAAVRVFELILERIAHEIGSSSVHRIKAELSRATSASQLDAAMRETLATFKPLAIEDVAQTLGVDGPTLIKLVAQYQLAPADVRDEDVAAEVVRAGDRLLMQTHLLRDMIVNGPAITPVIVQEIRLHQETGTKTITIGLP